MDSQIKAELLMCPPKYFSVDYKINPWMTPEEWARDRDQLGEKALDQWQALTRAIEGHGGRIRYVEPVRGLPDMVFTANAGIVLDKKALVARFLYSERQGEEPHFLAHFEKLKEDGILDDVGTLPEEIAQEGQGDCIWDPARKFFWAGYGQRSNRDAVPHIREFFDREVVPLELVDERFYHLDTCLNAPPGGPLLYYPGAFSAESVALIEDRVPAGERMPVSETDAEYFALNAVTVGDMLIMNKATDPLKAGLADFGITVDEVTLDSFMKSGGAAFCLSLRLDFSSQADRHVPTSRSAGAEAAGPDYRT